MTGTFINIAAILVGSALGILLGGRLPDRLKQTIISGLGLFTFAIGVQMFLKTQNSLVVLGSLVIGAILGEWWRLEDRLQNLGAWLEARFNRSKATETDSASQQKFIRGFLTASLVFLVGPMAILGAVQDGLTGNYQLLAVKSMLDGFAALAFASSLGLGVAFSVVPTLHLPGEHQPGSLPGAGGNHPGDDDRNDCHWRGDPPSHCGQRIVGAAKNPFWKFLAGSGDCSPGGGGNDRRWMVDQPSLNQKEGQNPSLTVLVTFAQD